jgi:hypothetical protein
VMTDKDPCVCLCTVFGLWPLIAAMYMEPRLLFRFDLFFESTADSHTQ